MGGVLNGGAGRAASAGRTNKGLLAAAFRDEPERLFLSVRP
ncbi:hypothetical protein ABZW18_25045 [Streptomyces sp. NPDC004647]